jgi:hypothetical protein
MPERRYLDELELTGVRAVVRELIHAGIVVSVVLATVGYFLPAQRGHPDLPFESYYDTGGSWLLFAIWLVALQWLRTRGRGYGSGYKLGVVAALVPGVGLLPLTGLLVTKLDHIYGHQVFWTGFAGIVGGGVLALIAEPILHIAERRHLERDVDPEFPTARVV